MGLGSIIEIVVVVAVVLFLLFLPKIFHYTPDKKPLTPAEIERERAYRTGLIIGSLMEEERQITDRNFNQDHQR